jgi:glycerophosphoryl diester phosphodiesterase
MTDKDVLVIAHRGASGYLPEHTLEAKALAYGMGADYLEQDVVATRDDELVVIHDIHLDRVSNVAEKFPQRKRDDGRYYVRDFDLAEIRTLRAWERRNDDGISPVFPKRFPTGQGTFKIPTLREEIKLVQGLNKSTGRSVGIYVEIKRPAWHKAEGVDISPILLQLLDDVGYRTRQDKIYVQCFDPDEVRRIRHELDCELKLTQLMDNSEWGDYFPEHDFLLTPEGLEQLKKTVDGIGPWLGYVVGMAEVDGRLVSTGLVSNAHAAGLQVHPWTFRADQLAPGFDSLQEMIRWFVDELAIDGVFTDFPDLAIEALQF